MWFLKYVRSWHLQEPRSSPQKGWACMSCKALRLQYQSLKLKAGWAQEKRLKRASLHLRCCTAWDLYLRCWIDFTLTDTAITTPYTNLPGPKGPESLRSVWELEGAATPNLKARKSLPVFWPLFRLYPRAFFPVVQRFFCRFPTEQVLYYRNLGLYYGQASTTLPLYAKPRAKVKGGCLSCERESSSALQPQGPKNIWNNLQIISKANGRSHRGCGAQTAADSLETSTNPSQSHNERWIWHLRIVAWLPLQNLAQKKKTFFCANFGRWKTFKISWNVPVKYF